MHLIDTNVLIDLIENDPVWGQWSRERIRELAAVDGAAINPVVYAELSSGFASKRELDSFLEAHGIRMMETPPEALFLAGKAFVEYRRRGGTKSGVLADFFIGAHASVLEIPLVTRDAARYRTYYPRIRTVSPERQ